jgi:hypothetical protein
MTAPPTPAIVTFRRRLLRCHGVILAAVALAAAGATTAARITGAGPFGFMHQNPWAWLGLLQAYLLMTIIAVLLVLGANSTDQRKWDVVGALAHCPPLLAALTSLPLFDALGALAGAWAAIAFHAVCLTVESVAALLPQRSDGTAPRSPGGRWPGIGDAARQR